MESNRELAPEISANHDRKRLFIFESRSVISGT